MLGLKCGFIGKIKNIVENWELKKIGIYLEIENCKFVN